MTKKEFWQRRREGFGMNLYRNKKDGWLGGVCAGLADHFNIGPWVAHNSNVFRVTLPDRCFIVIH